MVPPSQLLAGHGAAEYRNLALTAERTGKWCQEIPLRFVRICVSQRDMKYMPICLLSFRHLADNNPEREMYADNKLSHYALPCRCSCENAETSGEVCGRYVKE